ncbi:hypothetical protein [Winogradskyella thalassocola]|uniref:Uncharacterized protein n=1 Tax=Winogradskyella thalassocola TaxID=262004 RepID=A0A1G8IXY8_9FLAO|nr:hypothetical protein [Winogradskyella thalassocola]SDI23300.1 hypothetical protein SAMN04489796_108102 [Winogradskyella thalassocola]
MSYILSVKPQVRLRIGIIISILALISLYLVCNYDFGGFAGGFITGILIGLGFGLIVTHKKTN